MNDSVILIPLEGDDHDQRNGVCFSMAKRFMGGAQEAVGGPRKNDYGSNVSGIPLA